MLDSFLFVCLFFAYVFSVLCEELSIFISQEHGLICASAKNQSGFESIESADSLINLF